MIFAPLRITSWPVPVVTMRLPLVVNQGSVPEVTVLFTLTDTLPLAVPPGPVQLKL